MENSLPLSGSVCKMNVHKYPEDKQPMHFGLLLVRIEKNNHQPPPTSPEELPKKPSNKVANSVGYFPILHFESAFFYNSEIYHD